MGDKDKTEKILEAFNDVFSDLVNGCLFDGEPVTGPEDFEEATPYSYYKVSGQIRDQERDVAKYWKRGNMIISLIGLENQTEPDPYMPLRVMSYDAAAYRGQLSDDTINRPHPVMSLVLYWGYKRRWKTSLTVRECLQIPEQISDYVHDYRMNLFQIAWMSREEIDRRFHGDMWIVADYFYQRRTGDYQPEPRKFRHVRETLQLLQAMESDNRFTSDCTDMMLDDDSNKEGWTMCDVLDRVENRGIEKGRREGYRSAQADGARGMRREGLTDEQIARVYNTDVQTVQGMLRESGSEYEG